MARNDIDINLKTRYSGEGIKKLEQGLNNAGSQCKNVAGSVGKITGALGNLGSQGSKGVSKVANAIGGLASAFATGGVFGLAIAGVSSLIGFVGDKFDEMKNKAKEAAKKAAEALKKEISEATEYLKNKIDDLGKSFDRTTKRISDGLSINVAIDEFWDEGQVANIKDKYREKRKKNNTKGADLELSKAEEEYEITNINASGKLKKAELKAETASSLLDNEVERLHQLNNQFIKAINDDKISKEGLEEIQKQIQESRKRIQEYNTNFKVADYQLAKAKIVYAEELKKASERLQEAKDKHSETTQKEYLEEREKIEKEELKKANETAEERAKMLKEEKEQKKKEAKILFDLQIQTLKEEAEDKKKQAKAAIDSINALKGVYDNLSQQHQSALSQASNFSAKDLQKQFRNGTFSLGEDGQLQYNGSKDQRNEQAKNQRRLESMKKEYDRLSNQRLMGDSDIKRLQNLKLSIQTLEGYDPFKDKSKQLEENRVAIEQALSSNIETLNTTMKSLVDAYKEEVDSL